MSNVENQPKVAKRKISESLLYAKQFARERIDYLRSVYNEYENVRSEYLELKQYIDDSVRNNAINELHNMKANMKQWAYLTTMWGNDDRIPTKKLIKKLERSIPRLRIEVMRLTNIVNEIKAEISARYAKNNINQLDNIRTYAKQFKLLSPMNSELPFDFSLIGKELPNISDEKEKTLSMREQIDKNKAQMKQNLVAIDRENRKSSITELHNIRERVKYFAYLYPYTNEQIPIDYSNFALYKNVRDVETIDKEIAYYEALAKKNKDKLERVVRHNNTISLSNMRSFARAWLESFGSGHLQKVFSFT